MPLYTSVPMPPPLPPPLPRTPLFERTNKGASARGESAPVRVNGSNVYVHKMWQHMDERMNASIRQQQRYYHQYQYHYRPPQPAAPCLHKNPAMKALIMTSSEEDDKENQRPETRPVKAAVSFPPEQAARSAPIKNRTFLTAPTPVSRSIWPVPRRMSCDEEDPHRSIWSISPYELGLMMIEALRDERRKAKKSSQSAVVGPVIANEEDVHDNKVPREASLPSLRKYYSLPHMGKTIAKPQPSEKPIDVASSTTKSADSVPHGQIVLNYGKIFSLSVDTPIFYPKASAEDSNESEQKKPAPHMDWWPGDWKCKKCGNHVLVLADLSVHVGWWFAERVMFTNASSREQQNFSYREKCKRCKWCRLEDPSCSNAPHSM